MQDTTGAHRFHAGCVEALLSIFYIFYLEAAFNGCLVSTGLSHQYLELELLAQGSEVLRDRDLCHVGLEVDAINQEGWLLPLNHHFM